MSDLIYIGNARLSFPNLVEPQKRVNEQTGEVRLSYNCSLLIAPTDPGYQAFMKRYAELAAEKWKEHAQTVMNMIHQDRKSRCYAAGEEIINKKTFQPYDGYAGHVVISAGSKNPVQAIAVDGKPIDPANTMLYQQTLRKLYAGCRVNAAISPWIQENRHGRGIRCDLIAIQFAGDDAPFGAGETDASGLFGNVALPGSQAAPSAPTMPPLPSFGQSEAPGLPPFMMN